MIHLISDKLVELVEKHSDEILKRWVDQILNDPLTTTFSRDHISFIEERARIVLENLNLWVSYDTNKEEVGKRYAVEGKIIFDMSIPLCEALRALVVLRRMLWLFIINESAFDSAYQLHQMRELNERIILFFDRAQYYMTRGYMEALNKKMKELWNLTAEDTEKVFFDKSFYKH